MSSIEAAFAAVTPETAEETNPRSPLTIYRAEIREGRLTADPAQQQVVEQLDALHQRLVADVNHQPSLLSRTWSRLSRRAPEPICGLYIWGGVGRGKTHLVDMFYDSLPFTQKKRMHFHRFMHAVHDELKRLNRRPDPLDEVAATFADDARVICFDEFFVSDITDAMILAGLLRELFKLGVTMVATSNVVPDELYKNGLQRDNFLPAIDLIKRHMQECQLDSEVDYRLRALEKAEIYHSPLDEAAEESLGRTFASLSPDHVVEEQALEINAREIPTRIRGDGVVWFDFRAICDGPRSQSDYIEVSRLFNTVLISNVPQMGLYNDDVARRFISLVDEFYDRNVKLILSAAVPHTELYTDGNLNFEFQRTLSRLEEMQSHDYLASEHLP